VSYNPVVSRLRRIVDRDRIFFVTTSLAPGVAALSAAERDIVLAQMGRQHAAGDFLLFSYVVMPSHAHLLLAPGQCGLANAMQHLKRFTAQHVMKLRRSRGSLWQARYFDFILRRVADFWDKLEYIHENPVCAKLVREPEQWRWSSAAHYVGSGSPPVPVDSVNLPADRTAWLYPAPWRRL
jgi:REP element-mobilizing transposase RayT